MFFVSMFNLVLINELDFTFSFIILIWFDFLILIWVFKYFSRSFLFSQIAAKSLQHERKWRTKLGLCMMKNQGMLINHIKYTGKISICNLPVNIRLIKLCLPPIRVQASFRTVIRGGYNQRKYKKNNKLILVLASYYPVPIHSIFLPGFCSAFFYCLPFKNPLCRQTIR